MQRDRFAGGCGFLHEIAYQTTADTGVSILRQNSNVSQHYRRLTSINEYSANRPSVQKNDAIVYSRIGSFTSHKLHFDKGSLLLVSPTCSCQLVNSRAGINLKEKRLVLGRRLTQHKIEWFVFQSLFFDLTRQIQISHQALQIIRMYTQKLRGIHETASRLINRIHD